MSVDIDSILIAIGEVGLYQKKIYFLLCLPIIFVGAANLAYVFIAAKPDYRCFIKECDNGEKTEYNERFLNFTIPFDNKTNKYDFCHHYVRKSSQNVSTCSEDDFSENITACEYGYIFDKSIYESTIVSEFNLTCQNSWQASADQSVYFAGMLVGSIFLGVISDIYGRRKVILTGIAVMSVSGISIALVPNLFSFHVLRFINAMASVGLFQTAFILGLEFVGPSKRVMFGIIGEYFFAFGELFLGLMAWSIRSWRMLQLIISAPVTCFIFYYWTVPESLRWLQAKGRHAQVVSNLENIAKINKKTIPLHLLRHQPLEDNELDGSDDMAVLINRHHKVTLSDIFKNPVMVIRTIFMIIIWISTTLTYYGLSYNATELGEGEGAAGVYEYFTLSAFVEIPGYTFAWLGMEYVGRKWSLLGSLLFSGCACIATGYLKGFYSTLLIFLVGKCNITSAFAIIYVYTAELYPTNVRNTIIGLCSMFARIGGMIAPFSTTLKEIYIPLPMLLFGLITLLSSLLTITMPETLNTKLPETINDAMHLGNQTTYVPARESTDRTNEGEEERLLENQSQSQSDSEQPT